ncbi:endonuclease/exonuclease/phosphatase family protein [Actinopolyspora mortivallis]|uniref:endonuclease/exonuclease/phosphatase family protein n=1 Tax=Actinopolyspora mortivallis TaxID=33906 RepID=UPI0012EE83F1|nr:endonuclease/exonuclease/phosphatase family protein [Actinopolyspora mortivallis]
MRVTASSTSTEERAESAPEENRRSWGRRLRTALYLCGLAGLASVLWAGSLRMDLLSPWAQLSALRPQLNVLVLLLAVVPLWRRRLVLSALTLVTALVSTAGMLPPTWGTSGSASSGSGSVGIAVFNVSADGADLAEIARQIRSTDPEVVSLPEASSGYAGKLVDRLARTGNEYVSETDNPLVGDVEHPTRRSTGPYPTSLLVKKELRPEFDTEKVAGSLGTLDAKITGSAVTWHVAAVHPPPPLPGATSGWWASHSLLKEYCDFERPFVLAGDFNSTLNQGPIRQLTSGGCTDVGRTAGTGLSTTWPSFLPEFLGITIDHVLVGGSEVSAADYRTVDISGTDHRGLITEVELPRLN